VPKKSAPINPLDPLAILHERVKVAPTGPGVYRWLNKDGMILYVGKAKNLRKRLTSYVIPQKGNIGPWRQSFLKQVADFDLTVTNTELEALILETNLIKELKPKYNVLMKDDKNYVYIRIHVQDPFPRIDIVRKMLHDGAKYFGPKTSAEEARQMLTILRKIYPFRTCKMEILPADSSQRSEVSTDRSLLITDRSSNERIVFDVECFHKDRKTPCLDFHIEQCSAPCVGRKTPQQYYQESIVGVIDFLKGDEAPVKKLLKEKMMKAAADKKFEIAAQLRNHLAVLEKKDQDVELVSDTSGDDSDIVGVALLSERTQVVVLHRRGGKIIGEHSYVLTGVPESIEDVTEQFLAQFYDTDTDIPPTIIIGSAIPNRAVLEELFKSRRGKSVSVWTPERGKKSHLLLLAEKNAQSKARQAEAKWEADKRNTESALEELKNTLHLPTLPERIEGYDISHLGGTETVGSMVVMRHGKAANDHYRSFTIRTLQRGDIDDYWSLKEVLSRRLRRLTESIPEEEKQWNAQGITFGKAHKDEQETLEALLADHTSAEHPIMYQHVLVARSESDIVGTATRIEHTDAVTELSSLWVAERFVSTTLAQFLIRKLLKSVKKGKVYTIISPEFEHQYAHVGFRYVIRPPKILQDIIEQCEDQKIVLMCEAIQNKSDPSFSSRPDLLVIDGGKGQLSAVHSVVKNMGLDIPVIGLAKREEEVFIPGRSQPIIFLKDSPAKFLLMRLRDEAHRSANHHREGRGFAAMKASFLDDVPGIGDATKQALLKQFKTISAIEAASDETLKRILTDTQLVTLREELAYRRSQQT